MACLLIISTYVIYIMYFIGYLDQILVTKVRLAGNQPPQRMLDAGSLMVCWDTAATDINPEETICGDERFTTFRRHDDIETSYFGWHRLRTAKIQNRRALLPPGDRGLQRLDTRMSLRDRAPSRHFIWRVFSWSGTSAEGGNYSI